MRISAILSGVLGLALLGCISPANEYTYTLCGTVTKTYITNVQVRPGGGDRTYVGLVLDNGDLANKEFCGARSELNAGQHVWITYRHRDAGCDDLLHDGLIR